MFGFCWLQFFFLFRLFLFFFYFGLEFFWADPINLITKNYNQVFSCLGFWERVEHPQKVFTHTLNPTFTTRPLRWYLGRHSVISALLRTVPQSINVIPMEYSNLDLKAMEIGNFLMESRILEAECHQVKAVCN